MSSLIYLTLEGNIQGPISASCNSRASVGNRYQSTYEDSIFVSSLTQAQSSIQGGVEHLGLRFCKLLGESFPLFCDAINNNERLRMAFDIYRINWYGRMEKYYLIELRGTTVQAIHQEPKVNDMGYKYISVNHDYILYYHLVACTKFDYLLTPNNYDRLSPAVQKSILPTEQPIRKVTLVLGIFFDGAGNNAVNTRNMLEVLIARHFDIEGPDAQSIPARNTQEKMGVSGVGAASYLGYYTNIRWLNGLYKQKFPPKNHYVQSIVYIEDIGARASEPDNPIGLGLGTAETGIIAKTDDAMVQLATTIDVALTLPKRAFVVDTLLFNIFGFNRDAAVARHSANCAQIEDQAIVNAINTGTVEYGYRDTPTGNTRFLGIMDTVAAVGTVTDGLDLYSVGTGNVALRLHPGVVQEVFHLTTQNECRYNFALNSVAPAQPELASPGVRSDIGGDYMPQLREDLSLTRPQVKILPQDQPGTQFHVYAQTMAQLRTLEHPPVIMPIIRTHEVIPEVWKGLRAPTDHYTQLQKRTFTALTLRQRTVSSDWSKMALRVVVDTVVGAGALLADVDKIQRHAPPDALKPLCEQVREIRKAARQHRNTTGSTPEEVNRIADRYIHCSVHQNAADLKQNGELQGGASASETVNFVNQPDANWIRTIYNMDGNKQ